MVTDTKQSQRIKDKMKKKVFDHGHIMYTMKSNTQNTLLQYIIGQALNPKATIKLSAFIAFGKLTHVKLFFSKGFLSSYQDCGLASV